MSGMLDELHAVGDEILPPLRAEAGYPVDDSDDEAFRDMDPEVIHRYITSLEDSLVATTWVSRNRIR